MCSRQPQDTKNHRRWHGHTKTEIQPHTKVEDKTTTMKINKDKQTRSLIKHTWEPLLKRDVEINSKWIHRCEVLVGRRVQAPSNLLIMYEESHTAPTPWSVCNNHFPSHRPRPSAQICMH